MEMKKCQECGEDFLSYGEKTCEDCSSLKTRKEKSVKKQWKKLLKEKKNG